MVKSRATVIVETGKGFLLVSHSRGKNPVYMLPGGSIRRGERSEDAAKRELYEETGLHTLSIEYLFEVLTKYNRHIVFLAETGGKIRKRGETTHIRYYNTSTKNRYRLASHVGIVIVKYVKMKRENFKSRDLEIVSGICAGCERIFDTLYKKGRLYYCEECLGKIPKRTGVSFEKGVRAASIRRTKVQTVREGVKRKYPVKKIFAGCIFIVICILGYSVYVEFLNQEININNVIVEPKEVLSGDKTNIYVYVRKSSSVFGGLMDLINDLVGYSEYFNVSVNGISFKEVVDIRVNESKTIVFPILEKEPGEYTVSVNEFFDKFSVLSIARFEAHNITVTPADPHSGEDIRLSIFLRNIGGIEYTQFLECCIDGDSIEGEKVFLNPEESKQVNFLVGGRRLGVYNFSFSWETGEKSLVVKVIEPIIDVVTGKYNFWIDGIQHCYYLGLVRTSGGTGVNSYGKFIVLINNEDARNPTYSQLLEFLKSDKTDQYQYQYTIFISGGYYGSAESNVDLDQVKAIIDGIDQPDPPRICADFAETLHNNAEGAGIRCAYVSVELSGFSDPYNYGISSDTSHALVVFNTTDEGLVYIDVTGLPNRGPSSCDKIVDVKVGGSYIPRSLFPEKGWSSTWGNMGKVTDIFITWDGEWDG